jgi:heme-degrading monooxygenase HmoA
VIVLLFTTVPRDDVARSNHEEMTRQMHALADATPGFVDAEYYPRPDGGTFGVLRFEDEKALAAWRDHPDHAAVHQRGVDEVYASYRVEVCERIREARFEWHPQEVSPKV